MKKRIVKLISALFILSLLFQFTQAQNAKKSIDKDYNWNNETETVDVYVDVKSNAKEISMKFDGQVSSGNLTVTAYNPDGKKESGFCLITNCALECGTNKTKAKTSSGKNKNSNSNSNYSVSSNSDNGTSSTSVSRTDEGYSYTCSSSEDSTGAKGNMHEVMSDPQAGVWKFEIKVTEVTGNLSVDISQK